MKKIGFLSTLVFALIIVASCDTGINSDDGHNTVTLASIRSAAVDPVSNCAIEQVHQHGNDYYSGHYNNDGHGHHGLQANDICIFTDCEETALHDHNGTHYAGHHGSDNHNGHGNGHH
jgi:hypothetical protein